MRRERRRRREKRRRRRRGRKDKMEDKGPHQVRMGIEVRVNSLHVLVNQRQPMLVVPRHHWLSSARRLHHQGEDLGVVVYVL